jgi:hypothetical protein
VGIDIGSHRTRVCIWRIDTKTEIVVENRQYHNHGDAYTPCDFPSALYVFDDVSQPVYLLGDDDTGRRCVSAKYVFYLLANASDELLEQYPPVRLLMERKDDPDFRAQLRRAMVALLSVLHEATAAVCCDQGLRIVKIGLTIPVQWGLAFEDVYRSLVVDVFDIPDTTQIYFFTETEALSRYLYKYHARMLDPRDQHNAILFFDFGGHNMVTNKAALSFVLVVLVSTNSTLVLNRTVVSLALLGTTAVRTAIAFSESGDPLVRRATPFALK